MKIHGGKGAFQGKLAKWIISLMPPRDKWCHYVESYAGGLSVLLANDPVGISEVVNDLNPDITNFWRVMQSKKLFNEFRRIITAVNFSEREFRDAAAKRERLKNPVSMAVNFFIRCRQSLSGRMKDFAPLSKSRVRREMNEQASAWWTAIDGLEEVYERLKRVVVVGPKPALEVIDSEDSPTTLYYCDPPYLQETRSATSVYENEMSYADHEALLGRLTLIKGYFLLSGYRSPLYDKWAETHLFPRYEFPIVNNAAGGKTKREMIECIWTNYKPVQPLLDNQPLSE